MRPLLAGGWEQNQNDTYPAGIQNTLVVYTLVIRLDLQETLMELDPAEMKPVLNRLKRARGQLDAVIRSIENGEECRVAVHSLVTVSGALDRAGFAIISNSLQHVLRDPEQAGAKDNLGELEKLFLSLA